MYHVRPDLMADFVMSIDEGVSVLILMTTRISVSVWTETALCRMCLTIRYQGCGLQEVGDWRHVQFVGSMAQSIPHLVTRWMGTNIAVEGDECRGFGEPV